MTPLLCRELLRTVRNLREQFIVQLRGGFEFLSPLLLHQPYLLLKGKDLSLLRLQLRHNFPRLIGRIHPPADQGGQIRLDPHLGILQELGLGGESSLLPCHASLKIAELHGLRRKADLELVAFVHHGIDLALEHRMFDQDRRKIVLQLIVGALRIVTAGSAVVHDMAPRSRRVGRHCRCHIHNASGSSGGGGK